MAKTLKPTRENFVSFLHAARLLGCSRPTVYTMLANHELQSVVLVDRTYIRVDSLPKAAQEKHVRERASQRKGE